MANTSQENTTPPKKLANSRWAPGSFEDQKIPDQKMTNNQPSNDNAITLPSKNIASSRWATGHAPHTKTLHKKNTHFSQKGYKSAEKKHSSLISNQPRVGTNDYKSSFGTKTKNTTQRLVGPLSEENSVKVENPFFNPEKHKGLGSSSWANNDESFSTSQTRNTTQRLIGPLSEEEKTAKMENPFFDPNKHNGLGSSRWAN